MRKLEEILTIAIAVLSGLLAVVVLVGVAVQYRECQLSGGVFVRGLIGFECLVK